LRAFDIASPAARKQWEWSLNEIGHPEYAQSLPWYTFTGRKFAQSFMRVLDQITLEEDKVVWLEKTPGHLRFIKKIVEIQPDAVFIHILRNGLDNIASLYHLSQKYPESWGLWLPDLDSCIQRWVDDMRMNLGYMGGENHKLIRYEQLVQQPQPVLEALCQFIQVDFEIKMLTGYGELTGTVVKNEPWKSDVSKPIQSTNKIKSKKYLDEAQRQTILSEIPADLKEYATEETIQV
jgi:hypothetical protein